ncbi:unnamed protein product [Trichogramma brassicae]|uniref:Uncharacterized protein n=1 Tax=Trichogramma brassicae TaxID=86971 RepID=A0A6H5I1I7_9HYME|nr:unnamed protein product [Trichogramma brassicae]
MPLNSFPLYKVQLIVSGKGVDFLPRKLAYVTDIFRNLLFHFDIKNNRDQSISYSDTMKMKLHTHRCSAGSSSSSSSRSTSRISRSQEKIRRAYRAYETYDLKKITINTFFVGNHFFTFLGQAAELELAVRFVSLAHAAPLHLYYLLLPFFPETCFCAEPGLHTARLGGFQQRAETSLYNTVCNTTNLCATSAPSLPLLDVSRARKRISVMLYAHVTRAPQRKMKSWI